MGPRWRTIVIATGVAAFYLTAALLSQDGGDLMSVARDLRKSLRDLDDRLKRIEQAIREQSRNKPASSPSKAFQVTAPKADPATKILAAQDAYRRGRAEEDRGEFDKAIELFSTALDLDPGSDSAFLHRANANLRTSRFEAALADVNQALAIQKENSQAYELRSRVYRALKQYDRALADLEEALRRDEGNTAHLLLQAAIEEDRGNYKNATEIYGRALRVKPDADEIYLRRAAALRNLNDSGAAMSDCNQAIALKPNSAEAYACRADSFMRLGQLPESVADLNQALRLKPTLPEAASLLPVVRQLLEVNEASIRLRAASEPPKPPAVQPQPAQQEPPKDASPKQEVAAVPVQAAEIGRSAPVPPLPTVPIVRDLSGPKVSAPAATPNSARASAKKAEDALALGKQYMDQGKFPEAIIVLTQAVNLDLTSAVAFNSRGYAHLRTRALGPAISDFSAAIRINPYYANAYWNRGIARRLQGDESGGRQDMQKATSLGWPGTPWTMARNR
jgi:tetratricopeptide (TPR) repeat protein